MKKRVKNKWIKALLSGEYKQGTGTLHRDDTFCCLGVLCDLAAKEGVVETEKNGRCVHYGGMSAFLPPEVMEWAGLDSEDPTIPGAGRRARVDISVHNDNGKNFAYIAKLIERYL